MNIEIKQLEWNINLALLAKSLRSLRLIKKLNRVTMTTKFVYSFSLLSFAPIKHKKLIKNEQ